MTHLTELKKLAEAATPGPWEGVERMTAWDIAIQQLSNQKLPHPKPCAYCGAPVKPPKTRFCSPPCARRARYFKEVTKKATSRATMQQAAKS